MPPTLLEIASRRFGVDVEGDSSGGRILASLTPSAGFTDEATSGTADGTLSFALTADGVVPMAAGSGPFVFSLPGPFNFRLVPASSGQASPTIEIMLAASTLPLPFLRPATVGDNHLLTEAPGTVSLHLPELLLVVTATTAPPATAQLAPSHNPAGELAVTMSPRVALLGQGTVLGLEFDSAGLRLDGPGSPEVTVPTLKLYVAPEGIPCLALNGSASDLRISLGADDGGASGTFTIATTNGAQAPLRPEVIQTITASVRLERSVITLLELSGEVDLTGEVRRRLGETLSDGGGPFGYRLRLMLDDGWKASLALIAKDGAGFLWRTRRPPGTTADPVRNTLGAYAVFTPLLVSALPDAGGDGYIDLPVGAGASALLGSSNTVITESLTVLGGELAVRRLANGGARAVLFLDVEVELQLQLAPVVKTRRPIKVRQRAIGLRLDFTGGGTPVLHPVFDPGSGFSLDLSDPGTFEVAGPLGELLQSDGARMARNNPLNLELDLVTKANLGIVSIDRASIRAPILPPGPPTLTGLRAHLDVGAVQGSGYLKIDEQGVAGGLDVSLAPPLGIRARADLQLGQDSDSQVHATVTTVLADFAAEWPVPVPLGSSGLGLFGVLGLLAVHRERQPGDALAWLQRAGGDPGHGIWQGSATGWALGLGAVIGTVEGGFLIHAKGILMLELPGPRLLLAMKADLLSQRPPKEGPKTGSMLAVIEVRPDAVTIGVLAEYQIPFLLEVRVPAEAFFDLEQPQRWHLDIGAIPAATPPAPAASVRFMSSLRAEGYLLLHGDGIAAFPLRPLAGFAVAAGIRAAMTWGPAEIGLYIRVAVRADVGIGFKPLTIIGKVSLEGELHLFVISIGASASARLVIGGGLFFVEAQVCGEVDFFLFSVRGCVKLQLGDKNAAPPPPDPLVRALSLHSRSPALLAGSGADRPVDGSLGVAGPPGAADLPVVPIDAIPVLELEMRPHVPSASFLGTPIPSLVDATAWVRRGERFYRYTLRGVEISGGGAGGPVDDGDRPVVWWDRHGTPPGGDDSDVQLALLSWIPDPTPAAAERTVQRDTAVTRRFGDVCAEVAGPAGVLWSFAGVTAGPSPAGWTLRGVPAPDGPGTVRSWPAADLLSLSEPWRTGNVAADGLVQVAPGFVLASAAQPGRVLCAARAGRPPRPRIAGDAAFSAIAQSLPQVSGQLLADALRLRCGGWRRLRALVFLREDAGKLVVRGLDAQGSRTGFESRPGGRSVAGLADLPPEWRKDPWVASVRMVLDAWSAGLDEALFSPVLRFIELGLPGLAQIELGLDAEAAAPQPHWGLLLVEGLSDGELTRVTFDQQRQQARVAVVDGALGADPAKRALLRPGSTYTVTVTYDVAAAAVGDRGDPVPDGPPLVGQRQQFAFRTDGAPPSWLDPWVLATSPADGESAVFHGEPLRIVFSTGATRRLFAAYGKKLFAVVHAASGRDPAGGPNLDPASVNLDHTFVSATTIAPVVETPFAGALHELAPSLACISTGSQQSAHELVTLTLALEAGTEYILDLEVRPSQGPPSPPLLRRTFATSRYPSADAFAADIAGTPVGHRLLGPAASLTRLTGAAAVISDVEFELGLREARWGELSPPSAPRVTAIWQSGQPVALLVETTEAQWRTRLVPELPDPPADPNAVRRYGLVERQWLEVVAATPGPVARFVHNTAGTRTLAVLGAGARGSVVELSLRRTPHPLIEGAGPPASARLARAGLAKPPWEE